MLACLVYENEVSAWTARKPDEATSTFIARLCEEQHLDEELDPVAADRIAGLLMTP